MYNRQRNVLKPGAVTGPPGPSVYCSGKCFGGQKTGSALNNAAINRLMNFRIEQEPERTRGKWGFGGASGQEGTWEPRHPGRIPAVPPRCRCYDMCTALLFSFTTRALHLPGWPSLIKQLDLHAGDQTVYLLLFLLHFHFTSCGPESDVGGDK